MTSTGNDVFSESRARTTYRATTVASALSQGSSTTVDLLRQAGVTPSKPSANLASFVTISGDAKAIQTIKELAKNPALRAATQGTTDDSVRSLVRDGKIPTLPTLSDDQKKHPSTQEAAVYAVVSGLQGMHDAQPKSLDDALRQRVSLVLDSYPAMIAQEKADVASGKLPGDKARMDQIAADEEELSAAQQGRMKIRTISDRTLVYGVEDFTLQRSNEGWAGNGQTTVVTDHKALAALLGTTSYMPGSSPYMSPYAISW